MADELEEALSIGDFSKIETLINTNTRIVGDAFSHEIDQARFIGDYLGGGEFEFLPSKQGIEGYLIQGSNYIPISLKEYTATNIKNVFRKIRDNGNLIKAESLSDSRIIMGNQSNSVLFADIVNFKKNEVIDYIAQSSENILPSKELFKEIIFRTKDGEIFNIPLL